LRGDQRSLDDPLVSAYLEGVPRGVAIYCARLAKGDVQRREILRRMGLEAVEDNALNRELKQRIEAVLDELERSPGNWPNLPGEEVILENAKARRRAKPRPRIRLEEVKAVLPDIIESFRKRHGRQPNVREELPELVSTRLGKPVSGTTIVNARKALGVPTRHSPSKKRGKLIKTGAETGYNEAAKKQFEKEIAQETDFVSQSNRQMDQEAYRDKLGKMFPAELERECQRLHVSSDLTSETLLNELVLAQTLLESIKEEAEDLSPDDLRERVGNEGIPTDGLTKAGLIAALHRAFLERSSAARAQPPRSKR